MQFDVPITDVVLQFTTVVTAAVLVQVTLERSRIPGIVGLLLIGMLIGPGGTGVLPEGPVVELLGSIGLLYIMFIAGLEVDLDIVRRHKREAGAFGFAAFALSFVLAVAVGLVMDIGWTGAILLGAALSSHTLLAYPIVERLGLVHRLPVVATIGGTLITDTVALIVLTIVIHQPGGGAPGWLIPLVGLAGLAALALVLVPPLGRYLLDRAKATRAERVLFLLAVLLLLSAAAEVIGAEDILGAFLAGICLNRALHRRPEVREYLEFVGRMLFVPFFFVETGMRLELEVFAGHIDTWMMAALLLGAVVVGKSGAAWATGRLFGYSPADRALMAGLALPQAAATLAVVVTGHSLDLIGTEVVDAIIIVIFITCLLGPLVTRFAGARLVRDGRGDEAPN